MTGKKVSVTFDDRGGAGLMTLTFPLTSAGPGPTSAALKFYIFSAKIAIPLRLMLIPVFHPGLWLAISAFFFENYADWDVNIKISYIHI